MHITLWDARHGVWSMFSRWIDRSKSPFGWQRTIQLCYPFMRDFWWITKLRLPLPVQRHTRSASIQVNRMHGRHWVRRNCEPVVRQMPSRVAAKRSSWTRGMYKPSECWCELSCRIPIFVCGIIGKRRLEPYFSWVIQCDLVNALLLPITRPVESSLEQFAVVRI